MISYLIFLLTLFIVVILPGYLLGRIIIPPKSLYKLLTKLSSEARYIFSKAFYPLISLGVGVIILDFVALILNKFNVSLSFNILWLIFISLNIFLVIINLYIPRLKTSFKKLKIDYRYIAVLLTLIVLSIFIRTVFYLPDSLPQNTDLGHHMYWSQWINEKEEIPPYDTADVIVGEHVIFGVVAKMSKISILTAFPLIILTLFNVITVALLALSSYVISRSKYVLLLTILFLGIYFPLAPPQAKYVTGGVVGNTFGNLFISLIFLLIFIFFSYWLNKKERDYKLISLPISLILLIVIGSVYTHHLSALLLLFCLIFSFIYLIFVIFFIPQSFKKGITELWIILKNLFTFPRFLIMLTVSIAFPLIYIPFYLQKDAVGDVIEAPTKDTHLGFPLTDLASKLGEMRFIFSIIGVVIILLGLARFFKYQKCKEFCSKFSNILPKNNLFILLLLCIGWVSPLIILGSFPGIVNIDLPSRRVVNYLVFPISILAAYGFFTLTVYLKENIRKIYIFYSIVSILLALTLLNSISDIRTYYSSKNKFEDTVQLYAAAEYFEKNTSFESVILKDHVMLVGDNWLKVFLLRGYNYFLSRTWDYKYLKGGTHSDRDQCPRDMMVTPDSDKAKSCYRQTQTNYVILRPGVDDFLFWKSNSLDTVYSSDAVIIFQTKY